MTHRGRVLSVILGIALILGSTVLGGWHTYAFELIRRAQVAENHHSQETAETKSLRLFELKAHTDIYRNIGTVFLAIGLAAVIFPGRKMEAQT